MKHQQLFVSVALIPCCESTQTLFTFIFHGVCAVLQLLGILHQIKQRQYIHLLSVFSPQGSASYSRAQHTHTLRVLLLKHCLGRVIYAVSLLTSIVDNETSNGSLRPNSQHHANFVFLYQNISETLRIAQNISHLKTVEVIWGRHNYKKIQMDVLNESDLQFERRTGFKKCMKKPCLVVCNGLSRTCKGKNLQAV